MYFYIFLYNIIIKYKVSCLTVFIIFNVVVKYRVSLPQKEPKDEDQ